MLVGLGLAVLAGAVTMRATGMGFALIASPFLALILGPFQGVLVTNVCGALSAMLNLTQVHRQIDWRRARLLIPAGVLGVVPGAIATRLLPSATLSIVVSGLVLLGLAATLLIRRVPVPDSPASAAAGGLTSGFMSAAAGVGGPGLVVYALATRWEYSSFAASAQMLFALQGIEALVLKQSWPQLNWAGWLVLLGALGVGLLAGNALARHVSGRTAMLVVIVVATLGALLALAQGIQHV
jgi:uncharacterized membrane protein YfcA